MSTDPERIAALAPTGPLRVVINVGNPVLAARAADGDATGVSVDLARALADELGVEAALIVVDTAGESVERIASDAADVGFFAIDPARGAHIAFTAPYVLIEGTYLVREGDPVRTIDAVDRAGKRVVVGAKSAYDLFLTRELKHATIVRAASSQDVVDTFLREGADAAAGVRQPLEADARRVPGLRVLDGRFMTIRQAVGVPKRRGSDAARFVAGFVERMKSSGFVAAALARHGIDGAAVAPGAGPD